MKFLLLAALFSRVLAVPTGGGGGDGDGGSGPLCTVGGLFTVAQCCATDVLGLVDLDCQTPSKVPRGPSDFRDICADKGQRSRCCVLPVAGQAVLCTAPLGS
ncbi:fungal hydrophobin domain-containing protein [Hirsutella rhossiliensis]|uniref:Fungal hydrophobin domain-containing protein n=1 Tax=Hirsutella rhossiliensis TaxID=111463 RepID=A0A9P8MYJ1_9HYPO|nr:fungal hydrophobin domain-containing protein [Hirsutella rhossiliensis]KAH0962714.1 fungal hydrophobin domain-containing protein [Hirsutella rhossiliensis]